MFLEHKKEEGVHSETLYSTELQIPGIPFDGASEGSIEAVYPFWGSFTGHRSGLNKSIFF